MLFNAEKQKQTSLSKISQKKSQHNSRTKRQDNTMSVDGLRCIVYARIYIPCMRTILCHYIQTGRPPLPISSELKLKTNS